jgi:hypothetical protein
MKKFLLILALCAPLGLVAWQECGRLLKEARDPLILELTSEGDPSDPANESGGTDTTTAADSENKVLKTAAEKAKEVIELPPEVVRSAVALDDPAEPGADLPKNAIVTVVTELRRLRKDGHTEVEKAQADAADEVFQIENELTELRGEDGRPRNEPEIIKKLGLRLKAYSNKPVHDPDLIDSAKAEMDWWPKLEKLYPRPELDALYEKIGRWTPTQNAGEWNSQTLAVAAYKNYLDQYGKVKRPFAAALVREAKERWELWSRAVTLIDKIDNWQSRSTEEKVARIREVAVMASADNAPDPFVVAALRLARDLCRALIPEEKLDEKVVVNDAGIPRQIRRAALGIVWKDRSTTTLEKSGYNEWTLKLEEVEGLSFDNESKGLPKDGSAPLTPTDYSKAVYAYNAERARIKRWSGEDLSQLRRVYLERKIELSRDPKTTGAGLQAKLDALLNVVRRFPTLFAREPE